MAKKNPHNQSQQAKPDEPSQNSEPQASPDANSDGPANAVQGDGSKHGEPATITEAELEALTDPDAYSPEDDRAAKLIEPQRLQRPKQDPLTASPHASPAGTDDRPGKLLKVRYKCAGFISTHCKVLAVPHGLPEKDLPRFLERYIQPRDAGEDDTPLKVDTIVSVVEVAAV